MPYKRTRSQEREKKRKQRAKKNPAFIAEQERLAEKEKREKALTRARSKNYRDRLLAKAAEGGESKAKAERLEQHVYAMSSQSPDVRLKGLEMIEQQSKQRHQETLAGYQAISLGHISTDSLDHRARQLDQESNENIRLLAGIPAGEKVPLQPPLAAEMASPLRPITLGNSMLSSTPTPAALGPGPGTCVIVHHCLKNNCIVYNGLKNCFRCSCHCL